MRILLIEGDPAAAASVELMLKKADLNTYVAESGEEGLKYASCYDYDLIVLDLCLHDICGFEVLRKLRSNCVQTPVLILSSLADSEKKVRGLYLGADDYLTKPFDTKEFVARIHAIVRRSKGYAQSLIITGKITVNLDAKTVEAHGHPVHLTGKEYQLLELLSLRKGSTLTKEMFLNNLYGGMDEPEVKIVDVFIAKLRKKLASATGGEHYIETVWGHGYVLRDPEPKDNDLNIVDQIHDSKSLTHQAINLIENSNSELEPFSDSDSLRSMAQRISTNKRSYMFYCESIILKLHRELKEIEKEFGDFDEFEVKTRFIIETMLRHVQLIRMYFIKVGKSSPNLDQIRSIKRNSLELLDATVDEIQIHGECILKLDAVRSCLIFIAALGFQPTAELSYPNLYDEDDVF